MIAVAVWVAGPLLAQVNAGHVNVAPSRKRQTADPESVGMSGERLARIDEADFREIERLSPARADRLALIRAHPDLGTKARIGDESTREQAAAGLDRLTPHQYERITTLTAAHGDRFGFPFIVCAREHTPDSIIDGRTRRMHRNGAVRLLSSICCHCSSVVSTTGAAREVPALATRVVAGPQASSTVEKIRMSSPL